MKISKQTKSRALIVLAGLFVGISLFIVFKITQKGPAYDQSLNLAPTVTVLQVKAVDFRLQVQGFGVSRPAESWQAVANVSGRVVKTHPGLKSGVILPAGTELLVIDPSRYELTIAEANADLASLAAELAQLQTEKMNTVALPGRDYTLFDFQPNKISALNLPSQDARSIFPLTLSFSG